MESEWQDNVISDGNTKIVYFERSVVLLGATDDGN